MVYSFGNVSAGVGGKDGDEYNPPAADLREEVVTDEVRTMSRTMLEYWVSFMRSGQPGGKDLPAWPAYAASKGQAMVFGNYGVGAKDVPAPRTSR